MVFMVTFTTPNVLFNHFLLQQRTKTAGHWPDFGDGSDRAAVLAFIFAGANVARLVVPLRFAAAFAIVPWVDENIVQQFGIGGDSDDEAAAEK